MAVSAVAGLKLGGGVKEAEATLIIFTILIIEVKSIANSFETTCKTKPHVMEYPVVTSL